MRYKFILVCFFAASNLLTILINLDIYRIWKSKRIILPLVLRDISTKGWLSEQNLVGSVAWIRVLDQCWLVPWLSIEHHDFLFSCKRFLCQWVICGKMFITWGLMGNRCSSEFIHSRVCTHGYRFTTIG